MKHHRCTQVLAAAALALCACPGPRNDINSGIPPDAPILGTGTGDAGSPGPSADAGAGAGPDGGAGDGGCAGGLARPVGYGIDRCIGFTVTQSAALVDDGCSAVLFLDQVPICAGRIAGDLNAFSGTCDGLACRSLALPGRIVCDDGSDGGCFIDVCSTSDPTLCK